MRLIIAVLSIALPHLAQCISEGNRDNLRDKFLDFHNEARQRVAMGVERTRRGNLGPAKNMYKLKWNCEMELRAQKHIENCDGNVDDVGPFGANSQRYGIKGDVQVYEKHPKSMIVDALYSWWNEVRNIGLGKDNRYSVDDLYHYGNMVHAATTEIGCAYKVCKEKNEMQILCLYDDIGHIDNMTLFEAGKACTKDYDCTTYRNSSCYNYLCVKPPEAPDSGTNDICPDTDSMTDKMRNRMLELHNQYRSLVAKGEAEHKNGRAPSAARMLKLKYDCNLERLAEAHARNCVSEHSNESTRQGIGENLYSISIPDADPLKTGERACRTWFGELKQVVIGEKNIYSEKLRDSAKKIGGKIGHYTQMVWGTTEYIGCAIQNCWNGTLVVCNYNRTGNYVGRPIYRVGEPCSECPRSCTEEKLCDPKTSP